MAVGVKQQHGTMHVYKADLLNDLPLTPATESLQARESRNQATVDAVEAELLRNAPYGSLAGMSPQERAAWQHAEALRVMRSEAAMEHERAVVSCRHSGE